MTYLYIPNSGSQYGEIRALLVIGRSWKLSFEQFEALLEMSSAVLLQLVVNFAGASARGASAAAATAAD